MRCFWAFLYFLRFALTCASVSINKLLECLLLSQRYLSSAGKTPNLSHSSVLPCPAPPTCWFKFMKQRKSVRAAQQAFNFNRFFCVVSRSKHWPDWSTIVVRPQATRCPCVWPDTWHKHFACPAAHSLPPISFSPFRAWDLVSHAATATVACLFNWLSALGTARAQLHPQSLPPRFYVLSPLQLATRSLSLSPSAFDNDGHRAWGIIMVLEHWLVLSGDTF